MSHESHRRRAETLLRIHDGRCFVVAGNELIPEFEAMQKEGLALISLSLCPPAGILVEAKVRQIPLIVDSYEPEPQAH